MVRHLAPLGTSFYLPVYERLVRRGGRRFASYIPLFPGYVFLRAEGEARTAVLRSGLVVKLLQVRDQDLLHAELRQLRALQESGARLIPFAPLSPGDIVQVAEGPFRGYRGQVVREQSSVRLIVSVSMLRQSVAVEFDRSCLTRVSGSALAGEENSAVA